ncbi:aldo/keto reductase [Streptomyces canus]|uniref:aldo/keto reductase n=1 Tax=Streptomyces canus TaxID=58343 RepID=UPI0036B210C2
MTPVPSHTLNDGRPIPSIGLGTAPMDDEQSETAVAEALRLGYRLIDTGAAYGNETGVGRGIARSGVPRAEVSVVTKLPGRHHGYEETFASFEESRRRLGVEYIDLYLIHWPLPRLDKYVDSWKAMTRLRKEGRVRSIGVSNFLPRHLERLVDETGVVPAVNQIEGHPQFPQHELRAVHTKFGIQTMCYSPLGRGTGLLDAPDIVAVARAHGVTPAQVVLRWHVQLGAVPLPRASSPRHQLHNLAVFEFTLTDEELARIDSALDHRRIGFDPETHEEF